jgi:hypothetical protein
MTNCRSDSEVGSVGLLLVVFVVVVAVVVVVGPKAPYSDSRELILFAMEFQTSAPDVAAKKYPSVCMTVVPSGLLVVVIVVSWAPHAVMVSQSVEVVVVVETTSPPVTLEGPIYTVH